MVPVLEHRISSILTQESNIDKLDAAMTIGELFRGNRLGLISALARIEITSSLSICDPSAALEKFKKMTVGAVLWGAEQLADPENAA
jgi:hypothetical protein